jgi:aerobic carbon-monoxide dehydrogenase medium subunit
MKAAAFEYFAPTRLSDALAALASGGEDARAIAGGQSLGPMLNLRLATPSLLIDLTRIPELRRVEDRGEATFIGAIVTHAAIEDRRDAIADRGVLASVARGIAYRSVRNRGTVGGSLAHADPAADWLTTLTALGARVAISRRGGSRQVELSDFVRGAYATTLQPGEIVEGVLVPKLSNAAHWGYYKICRKPGEYAEAMVAVLADPERRICRIVMGATAGAPVALDALAQRLASKGGSTIDRVTIMQAVGAALPQLDAISMRVHAAAVTRAIQQVVPTAAAMVAA